MGNLINTINHARKHMVKLAGTSILEAESRGENTGDWSSPQGHPNDKPQTSAGLPPKSEEQDAADKEFAHKYNEHMFTKGVLDSSMKHTGNVLKRLTTQDALMGGAVGAAAGGGLAYLLARLLKRKRAWAYGLGGAVAGGAAGAYGGVRTGEHALNAIKDWLNKREALRKETRAERELATRQLSDWVKDEILMNERRRTVAESKRQADEIHKKLTDNEGQDNPGGYSDTMQSQQEQLINPTTEAEVDDNWSIYPDYSYREPER